MQVLKQILNTVAAAFSIFSAIPMPRTAWNERNLRSVLCAFPLVGAAVGLCWMAWDLLCAWLGLPAVLRGAGRTLLPVLLTGGIHLDGYADTADALASHAPPERKREILRDPHCGAFAVLRLCMYFTATFGLCAALEGDFRSSVLMFPSFLLSRALSGAALTVLPLSENSSLARMFVEAADRRRVRGILLAETLSASLLLCALGGLTGALMLLAALATLARYARVARREFGGASGDLAGWFLQNAELRMLAVLTLARYVEAAV